MNRTDRELGYQEGRLGNEARYPNNRNYMQGFESGTAALQREIAAWEPFESMVPSGTNDVDVTQHYC